MRLRDLFVEQREHKMSPENSCSTSGPKNHPSQCQMSGVCWHIKLDWVKHQNKKYMWRMFYKMYVSIFMEI